MTLTTDDEYSDVIANSLWLIKLSGGDANRRFIMARGQVLRSIENVRFRITV